MVMKTFLNLICLGMILLASAAHYKDWGSSFMFDMDILELRISSITQQQSQQTSPGLLLLMKLGAFNSCLQVPNTVQIPAQIQNNQQSLLAQAFAPEQPQPPCSYGENVFPPTLPIRTLPVDVLKTTNTIFLIVSSSFIVLISAWSIKTIVSIISYFKGLRRLSKFIDFLAVSLLSTFVLIVIILLLTTRKLLTRRSFYNHIGVNVSVEPGGGFYILILSLITYSFLTIGIPTKKKRSNKVISLDDTSLPPPRP